MPQLQPGFPWWQKTNTVYYSILYNVYYTMRWESCLIVLLTRQKVQLLLFVRESQWQSDAEHCRTNSRSGHKCKGLPFGKYWEWKRLSHLITSYHPTCKLSMDIAIKRKFYEVNSNPAFPWLCRLILGSIQFYMCLSKLTMSLPTVGSKWFTGRSRISHGLFVLGSEHGIPEKVVQIW